MYCTIDWMFSVFWLTWALREYLCGLLIGVYNQSLIPHLVKRLQHIPVIIDKPIDDAHIIAEARSIAQYIH